MDKKKVNETMNVIANVLKWIAIGILGYFVLKFLIAGIAVHMLLAFVVGLFI